MYSSIVYKGVVMCISIVGGRYILDILGINRVNRESTCDNKIIYRGWAISASKIKKIEQKR